jgi:quercetin dioxygenase-like cupin family protein
MVSVPLDRGVWRWARRVGMLLALSVVTLVPAVAAAQAPSVQQTVLARGRDDLPAEDLLFRIAESSLPAGQPGVTHAHASGFDYAVEGTHVLTVGGTRHVVAPGQATWVGTLQEHTHADLGAGMRFWFIAVRPSSTRGLPGMWPYPGSRLRSESEDFRLTTSGPHDLVLSEIRLTRPGDAIGPLAQRGPVGVTVVEGQVSLGGQVLLHEGVVIQWPDNRSTFVNAGAGPARMLALAVMPAGAPAALLPQTGDGLSPAAGLSPRAWGTFAAAAGGLLILGIILRRPRRTTMT